MKIEIEKNNITEIIHVDDKIAIIVKVMNERGYITKSSSQGSLFNNLPYIKFYCPQIQAILLEKKLREVEREPGKLNWSWKISSYFDENFETLYILSPKKLLCRIFKYFPYEIYRDFFVIEDIIEKIDIHNEYNKKFNSKKEDCYYKCQRNGLDGDKLLTLIEVEDFIKACGISENNLQWDAVLSGWPLEIDGATVRFILHN